MKSFKQYLAEAKRKNVDQGVMVNGVPSVVVFHDREPLHVPEVQQGVVVNGVPAAVVLNDRKKLKEDRITGNDTSWGFANHNHHLGATEDDVENSMHNVHQHSPEALKHLHTYTEGSRTLNTELYTHHVAQTPAPHKVDDAFVRAKEHDVHALDKAVEHHTLGHDLHVYSGVHFHPGEVSKQHEDRHIHLPAYTSSSIDKHTAVHFAHSATFTNRKLHTEEGGYTVQGHILHVHLKAGDKGAYVGDHSAFKGEKEFILPRNTRLKVHPTPTMHHNNANGHTYAVWHAETVKQD